MFQSFTVKNFRCFHELTLAPLERINLIAGKNNSGKTALLEAIHLFCNPNDCPLLININKTRGIDVTGKDQEAIGSWLFAHRNPAKDIELSSEQEEGMKRTLKITLADAFSARAILPEPDRREVERLNPSAVDINGPYFILRYQEDRGEWLHSVGLSNRAGFGMTWVQAQIPHPIACTFLGTTNVSSTNDAEEFGKIEAAKRQEEVLLPALRVLEPRLNRLSLIPFAGKPIVHGDIQGLDQLIPIPLMGEGIRRLLSILLVIANARNGVILIDEIENGLHYSVLKDVWRAIALAARTADVQVFATTHSWECIRYAHEAFEQDTIYDLRLHRIDRFDDRISTVSYTREMIETALYSGVEMR